VRVAAGLAAALALGAGGAAARPSPPSYALPSWSPDGQRLAFASASTAGGAVVTADAGGGSLRRLSRTGALSQVVWSPRGGWIAYGSRDRVYVIRSDGKQRHAVGSGVEAAWSPDGAKLAFVRSAVGGPIDSVDAGGGDRTRLTGGRFDHAPAWSPDGSRLAFSRATTIGGAETLYVVGADGTGLRSLGPQGASPAWSPDGRALAFWQRNSEGVTLGVLRFAGEQVVTLTRTFAAYSRAPRLVSGRNEAARHGLRAVRRVPARRGRRRRQRGHAARPRERSGLVAGRIPDRLRSAAVVSRLERLRRARRRNRPAADHALPLGGET